MAQKLAAILVPVFVLLSTAAMAQDQGDGKDQWASVRVLEGVWEGNGAGFGQTSTVTHTWRFVLDGNFLQLSTKSVTDAAEDGDGEIHEDVGYVSWSEGDETLRFRQFLSEGFVNSFTIQEAAHPEVGLNFEPVSTDGMATFAVRMTLRFSGEDAYEMIMEMGTKGKELQACQSMELERVN